MYRQIVSRAKSTECEELDLLAGQEECELGASGAPKAQQGEGIRLHKVLRVRRKIAAGTYDTPERWEQALDRLALALL